MGQFSWFTQDDHSQIKADKNADVYMVDSRDGTIYKETCYEGYGIFGGRDFYELFADMNKDIILWRNEYRKETFNEIFSKDFKDLTEKELRVKRNAGVSLWFDFVEPDYDPDSKYAPKLRPGDKLLVPILVRDPSQWKKFKNGHPDIDPDQGC